VTRLLRPLHVRLALVALAGALTTAACGHQPDPLEIGLRRVALDLSFKDPAKAAEVSPRAVVTQLELADPAIVAQVPEEIEEAPRRGPKVIVVPARKAEPVCETAPAGAGYDTPTYPLVKDPPVVGSYPRHYTGTVKLQTTLFDLSLPYPPKANTDITDLAFVTASTYVGETERAALPAPAHDDPNVFVPKTEFKLTHHGPSGLTQVDTFQYTAGGATGGDFLLLTKRETTVNGATTTFTPEPPIRYIKLFTPEGDDSAVSHAGVDRATQTALAVQSRIMGRESVDVCGEVVDTFRVQIQENFVDLTKSPPETSGNENGTANFWNIQFDHGLLLVREEVHTTFHGSTEVAGAPVPITIVSDYVGTLDSMTPQPLKARSSTPAGVSGPKGDGGGATDDGGDGGTDG
jgi:hypothetical protein